MKNWIKSLDRFLTRGTLKLLTLYQKTISPDHGILQTLLGNFRCRFYPSCSDYALGSIRQYGLGLGIVLSLFRIVRCNPFNRGGYDPVERTRS